MKDVEVLLRERVGTLGRCGDVVKVKPGYARNYLYPLRLAVPATEENKRQLARRAKRMAAEEAALMADIEKKVAALSALTLETAEKADENGHLYGSVSAARAAEILTAAGYPCGERDVRLERPIKTAGSHEVPIHVHEETFASFTLVVNPTE
jgi:large subunit ribosomal protein L9